MLKNILIAAVLTAVLGLAAAGCRARAARIVLGSAGTEAVAESGAAALGGKILRSADAAVAGSTKGYFAAGLGLLVAGGAAVIVGARRMGAAAMALGCAVSAMGVVIVRYPWAILMAFLLAVAALGLALFDRWRKALALEKSRNALTAAAQVIQNLPEGQAIKRGLSDLGSDIAAQVREVVSPIKDQLRREGKITA